MPKKTPNLFQKIVRKSIRNIFDDINAKNTSKTSKPKKSKSKVRSSQSKSKNKQTRSRYISASDRVFVLNRDNYKCVFCGRNSKQVSLEMDHVIPFVNGGSNKPENLQTLCFDCNRGKGTKEFN